jgi:hypothetical protein
MNQSGTACSAAVKSQYRKRAICGRVRSLLPWVILAVLFVLPNFIRLDFSSGHLFPELGFTLPHVYSGDEPHYLIMINSLVHDHDLFIDNNYKRALKDKNLEAGARYAGRFLNRHMSGPAQPWHWPGMPMFVAALVWPLADTPYLESAAVFMSAIVGLVGLVALALIARHIASKGVFWTIAFVAFGTPVWHYSGRLFTEIYLFALLSWAMYFGFVKSRWSVTGVIMALGVVVNITFIVPLGILGLWMFYKRNWRCLVGYAIPFMVILSLMGVYYIYLYWWPLGSAGIGVAKGIASVTIPTRAREFARFIPKNLVVYGFGMFFSTLHGFFIFSPMLFAALWGIPASLRRSSRGGLVWIVAGTSLFFSTYSGWWGGHCYANRHLVAYIAIFAIWFHFLRSELKNRIWRTVITVFIVLSVVINAQGAFAPAQFFDRPPWSLVYLDEDEMGGLGRVKFRNIDMSGGKYTANGTVLRDPFQPDGPGAVSDSSRPPFKIRTSFLYFPTGSYEARFWLRYSGGGIVGVAVKKPGKRGSIYPLRLRSRGQEVFFAKLPFEIKDKVESRFFPYRRDPVSFLLRATGDADVEFHKIEVLKSVSPDNF